MTKPKRVPGVVRLEQAWKLWQSENPTRPANITAIAKLAGIERSNVYDPRYSKVLEKIQISRAEKKVKSPVGRSSGLRSSVRMKEAEFERDIALYLWLEREGGPRRAVSKTRARSPAAPVLLQKIESASRLETAAGKFIKRAVLSYLGAGTVSLAGFDSLDLERRALLLHFLELRSRDDCPSMEAYEHLRMKLVSGPTQSTSGSKS